MSKISTLRHILRLELGIKTTQYQHFILLTPGRSGSSMLIDCLNQNPAIVCDHEVFNPDLYPKSAWRRWLLLNHPARYLRWLIYRQHPLGVSAVGFSIHYYHCHAGKLRRVWAYLAASPWIKILHLKRNPFNIYLSSQLARKTGFWHARDTVAVQAVNERSIELTPDGCRAYFQEFDHYSQYYGNLFQHHDVLEIWYEDMVGSFDNQLKKIQAWLGVEPQSVQPAYHKLVRKPVSEVVINYRDLLAIFERSPWSDHFSSQMHGKR